MIVKLLVLYSLSEKVAVLDRLLLASGFCYLLDR